MDNYKQLALRYLKLNKNRSIITVIGTAITVTVLFALLNLGWSAVLNLRTNLRQEQDYEVVFLTETKEQIDAIIQDDRVKSASVGSYYYYDYNNPVTYDNALFVNFKNPYNMDKLAKEFENMAGVEFDYNGALAATYLQGGEDYLGVIVCSLILLVSFVFAIFGVGIVRNSIQLCTLEQIKDYGNLRCIGSTKSQLKSVIYLEGAVLEVTGMIIGILTGTLVSAITGHILEIKAGFHFLPVVPVCIAFLGDLYFVMEENCKVVTNMTPVSAIRGEFRIKKEKIKRRHSGLIGKIFGVEGDYAYKNMMRNPARFWKTTWAIGIGVAAFIATVGITHTLSYLEKEMEDSFGYYQVYFDGGQVSANQSVDEARSVVNPNILEDMSKLPGIVEAKQVYCAQVLLSDWKDVYAHYSDDYKKYVWGGILLEKLIPKADKMLSGTEEDVKPSTRCMYLNNLAGLKVYGYDEADMKRYKDALVEGTLDVSDNGILIVNHCKTAEEEIDENMDGIDMVEVDYTDYKVGDTIDIVDAKRFRELYLEQVEPINRKYSDVMNNPDVINNGEDYVFENGEENQEVDKEREKLLDRYYDYLQERAQLYVDCYNRMIQEGAYKTYTIEGILKDDVNRSSSGELDIILPLKQYYTMSGTEGESGIGMQYHFDKFPTLKYNNLIGMHADGYVMSATGEYEICNYSMYPELKNMLLQFKGMIIGLIFFVLFVVLISCINIVNTTASNIHLRRQEFAQLRVIGVSKKGLVKMVILEGVISAVFANVIGAVIGLSVSYGLFRLTLTMIYGFQYRFPWEAILISIAVSSLVLCGSIYIPLKKLDGNMADSLKSGNE